MTRHDPAEGGAGTSVGTHRHGTNLAVSNAWTLDERDRLEEVEVIIEAGLASFVEVGEALADVRDKRLYRTKYTTFEIYCSKRWGLSRSRVHRLIDAAEVVDMLPIGNITGPANEAQARPLAALRDKPEEMAEAWNEAQEAASTEDRKVTAADVTDAVKKRTEPAPRPPKPRRQPLADAAGKAGWEFRRAVERLERIAADDRFPAHREQVATRWEGHVDYALDVLSHLREAIMAPSEEVDR